MIKYGLSWKDGTPAVEIERHCIRNGGKWTANGIEVGEGLFHHFKAMESILWPEDDHHRWSDLILKTILEGRISVIAGCRDSSKTRTVSKWALCDYWCWPNDSLFLMTSTTSQGLEMRVFGDIKSLFERALERCPWLEGNVVDSKRGIFTDNVSDDMDAKKSRDMRKGFIGIPCMTSEGEYAGMALKNFAGIKQKRRRLIGDELQFMSCFPEGTLVDTPNGKRRIESIQIGDYVIGATGFSETIGTSVREAQELVLVKLRDGRTITCTPEHPFFTNLGWIKACELSQSQYILSAYEAMCILWSNVLSSGACKSVFQVCEYKEEMRVLRNRICRYGSLFKKAFLQSQLLVEMAHCPTGVCSETLQSECDDEKSARDVEVAQGKPSEISPHCQSDAQFNQRTGVITEKIFKRVSEENGAQTESQRGKWHGSNQSGMAVNEDVSRRGVESSYKNRTIERQRVSHFLQSGLGFSEHKVGHRSRWCDSWRMGQSQTKGQEERTVANGSWVESVEILKSSDSRFPKSGADTGRCRVYNLQVEGHPSYSVNGVLVHNCDYLKVLDSMDKGEFKAVLLGNMIAENGKALDRVSEPINGWDTVDDSPKTKVWKNKYNGTTVNLCGPDSPNFDPETKDRYPYMLSQSDIDSVSARPGGKDSVEWWSQIMGLRKVGVVSDRPFTVNDVRNNKGFEPVVWKTTPQRGLAIDAGYGGDDCVKTVFYWGTTVDEIDVIAFMEQSVYPVLISSKITPEDQIATAAKADCAQWNIPYENVFIEAGMRATLAVSFGRILAPSINAINFGGSATDRPVASDLFVKDEKTGQRRLKTCIEHYSKFVTELVFAVRDAVICGQTRLFPIRAAEEFQRRKWRFVYGDRYEIETKLEYKERNASKSPNDSDSIMIAVEGARRRGFKISNARKDDLDAHTGLDWLRERSQKNREMLASKQLARR